ncbi:hypothetical protein [Paracraurococcus ruber]|uniref:Lipoprotein n=1 Tax=Paracraurococcus ruber TaxID=77675 RepID=A0ABS1D1P5_9PROT|nr:hypothetical protein [Paracraurococcus ruber]MBK1660411.1 hypothetical protein [Paracraurococcus ruber]TDG27562.1 hypothetical protein E2C05_22430 [Paracraurococcus ruber]
MRRVPVLLLVLAAAACHPTQSDLAQLGRMQRQPDPRVNAGEQIACDARDPVCVRLQVARGSACQQLAEALPTPDERLAQRRCALEAFTAARGLLPDGAEAEDRRQVLVGLAFARSADRDNAPTAANPAAAAARDAELAADLPALRATPRGAPYAAFFEAQSRGWRALRPGLATPDACRLSSEALAALPADPLPDDLRQKATTLRGSLGAFRTAKGCA